MENKTMENQGLTPLQTGSLQKILSATVGLRISDATEDQISTVLKKIFALLGIPPAKLPNELEKMVILEYMKDHVEQRLEEIVLAFQLALTGKFDYDLNLYGEPFSVKYLAGVLKAYDQFKLTEKREAILKDKKRKESGEVKINNANRLLLISSLLSPETLQAIDDMGKPKDNSASERKQPEIKPLNSELDKIQGFLKEFDDLYKENPIGTAKRFIDYNGKILDQEEYAKIRLSEPEDPIL